MIKISCSMLLLSACNGLFAMDNGTTIQVPATIIRERLYQMHLGPFVEKTHIDKKLSERPLYPIGFVLGVDNEILLYLKDIRKRSNNAKFIAQSSNLMWKMRPLIIKTILEDHPREIEILIQEGFLEGQPSKKMYNIHWKTFIENK